MKPRFLRFAPIVFLSMIFSPLSAAHASSAPPDSIHLCAFDEQEQWRADHPRPAAKRPADLNVGKPRTVRMIYFLPSDRPFRQEVVDSMKVVIRRVQTFYAEQMEAQGYGYKTFRIETDALGEPQVHRVDGQHPESHYFGSTSRSYNLLWRSEIQEVLDLNENISVIYRESPNYTGGQAGLRESKKQGEIRVTWVSEGLFSHELAHAFGLAHDFRDGAYILSYGGPSQFPDARRWDRISACTAEFLSVHPYFNSAIPIEESSPPTIKLVSSTEYPAGSQSVSIKVEVSDVAGLHQVLLYALPGVSRGLRECRALGGQRDAVVEFEFDGSPMATNPEDIIKSLSDPLHVIEVLAVDTDGDISELQFDLVPDRVTDALEGHTDHVNTVAFSPDGRTLASGSSDGTVKLWDVSRRELLATPFGHTDPVMAVAFSLDGAFASGTMSGVKLWDVRTRKETATLRGTSPVAFSPDGTLLASGSGNRTIALWDARTLERIATLEGHAEQINTVAFSPDGTVLASGSGDHGSEDQTVRLWDVEKREEVATFEHTGAIWSVAFSPDGAILASAVGSPDNVVRLWDVRTHGEIDWLWHREPVLAVTFSRGASIIASGSRDGNVRLYDGLTRDFIGTFLPFRPSDHYSWVEIRSVAISPDATTLAAGTGYGTIELRDVSEWKRPPFPSALEIISGDGQQGKPGAALTRPLVVEVRDQYGDLLPEASVTFTVTGGEGKLSGRFAVEHAATDADGRAELLLTLGPNPGPNIVGVSLGGRELATFTADGVGTAVAELEGNYRTWHLPAGATARLGKGRLGISDRAVALSADGRCLAVASAIGVWLYEASTSRAQALLPSESPVHSVSFSLAGTLAAGLNNGRVELWEVETGERIGTLRPADWGRVTVVFSPDGTKLASGSLEQVIKVWDIETRRVAGTWEVARDSDSYWDIPVAFSPDGTRLLSGFQDGTVRLWDVASQTEVATLEGHTDRVTSVSFSPDGATLASSGGWDDPTVRLWDVATQAQVAMLRGHRSEVRSVAFSPPDGATLASAGGGRDPTVRLWDVATREETATLEEHGGPVHSVTFSRDGSTLVSGAADGTVLLRELETGNAAGLSGHGSLSSMAFSPDGTLLASGYLNGTIRLWAAATRTRIATLEGHTSGVTSVSFSVDGALLASGSRDRTVKLWDVGTREEIGTLKGHTGEVTSVSFSPDGAILASAGGWNDATVRLWDVGAREPIGTLEGHTYSVRSVAFSPPGGAFLASAGGDEDKTVKLWDVANQQLIATLEGHENGVYTVAFSPDGNILASVSWDGTRLWSVTTREPIGNLEGARGRSAAFSPDGKSLVSGSWGTVSLWDMMTKRRTANLQGHTGLVHSVAFTRDGATLASGASDGTMLLWNLGPHPRTLTKVPGRRQQGPAGTVLDQPFVVLVLDQYGDPLAGATVTFRVTAGGGTLSVTTATTDADGRAATTLTLGSRPGANTVVATVEDLEPATFTATAKSDPDFDGDGTVGFADFVQFAAQFGLSQGDEGYDASYDLDGNDAIGFSDFLIFAGAFGKS